MLTLTRNTLSKSRGTLSITLDPDKLAQDDLTDEDIGELIDAGNFHVEIQEIEVA
jgi:multidrug efflux pump subunit AcrB